MLFNLKQFEQFFTNSTLKKGLSLFDKGRVEAEHLTGRSELGFKINSYHLVLKRRGDKLLSYECTCRKTFYCEHLAASLFFLQRDSFRGLSNALRNNSLNSNEKKVHSLNSLKPLIELSSNKALKSFLHHHESEIESKDLRDIFQATINPSDYELFCLQLHIIFSPYLALESLNQTSIDKLVESLDSLIREQRTGKKDKEVSLELYLALLTESHLVLNLRFTGNEQKLISFFNSIKNELELVFAKGLNVELRNTLFKPTLRSLKDNTILTSETFLFLIPRFLKFSRSRTELGQLEIALDARKYKRKHSDQIDKLLLAKLQVWIRQAKLFKLANPAVNFVTEVEFQLAEAELYFCSNKPKKALNQLYVFYEGLSQKQKKHLPYLREYILMKARENKDVKMEFEFLKEDFRNGLFILPDKLTRLIELIPTENKEKEIEALVLSIKTNYDPLAFDKISTILLQEKRYDELLKELKKQDHRFLLLHQVVLLKLPDYNQDILNLYTKQLLEALSARRIFHRPEELFDLAHQYISQLHPETQHEMATSILNKLGGQSGIHKYVQNLFGVEA